VNEGPEGMSLSGYSWRLGLGRGSVKTTCNPHVRFSSLFQHALF
jgi:hypothetical protein